MAEHTSPTAGLAVVVVNYGSTQLLAVNLAAVARNAPDAEIVVVDNFHSPAERAAVEQLCRQHGWTLVGSPTNLGFGGGVGLGVAEARRHGAKVFVLLNPDATIDAASLAVLTDRVRSEPMTLAGPRIVDAAGRPWSAGTDLYLDSGAMLATRKRPAGEVRVFGWLSGACLAFHGQLWDAVGGFDDDYFLYWEDVDFCWRAAEVGARLMVLDEATVVHDEGGTQQAVGPRGLSETYYYSNIRNRLVFAAKHLDADDRRRWRRSSVREAYAILLRGGRRQLLGSVGPWRAAIRGTIDGLRWMRRAERVDRSGADRSGNVDARLRVLQSFPEPRPTTNPYIVMLRNSLAADSRIELATFSWSRFLTGRFDVFHAHWPEILVNGQSPVKRLARQALFLLGLLRLRARRVAIVRTLHNLDLPTGISRRERWLLQLFQRWTTLLIALNPVTEISTKPSVTILHGHYRDWYAPRPRAPRVAGRMAYVGLIRRYKAVDTLIRAFTGLPADGSDMSLYVGGRPSSTELATELADLAGDDQRIELALDFLSDDELVAALTAAELVVLPYREMHNSGTVLAALSLDARVLVPDNAVNDLLSAEVGPGWVFRYTGAELTADDLRTALAQIEASAPGSRPDLSARDWDVTAGQHVAAYSQAVRLRR